jgi:hypothetical protein
MPVRQAREAFVVKPLSYPPQNSILGYVGAKVVSLLLQASFLSSRQPVAVIGTLTLVSRELPTVSALVSGVSFCSRKSSGAAAVASALIRAPSSAPGRKLLLSIRKGNRSTC